MKKFTNRVLQKATGHSYTQIKRWAPVFLGPDPLVGQHSGVERLYTLEEAIKICLGGYFVNKLNFRFKEAAMILTDLTKWLMSKGLTLFKKTTQNPGKSWGLFLL